MATRVDLTQFSLARLKRPTPKTPHRERIALHLSLFEFSLLCQQGFVYQKIST